MNTVDRNIDAALLDLRDLVHSNLSTSLAALCDNVLNDPRFKLGWGSASDGAHGHHSYSGGLVIHTLEVASIALAMCKSTKSQVIYCDSYVVLTAAVFHDYMKIKDYDPSTGEKTEYRRLIRHLSGSYAAFSALAYDQPIDAAFKMRVEHCILAHHGRQEWGTPIEPQTCEAHILHYADMLSMMYGKGR